MIIGNFAIQLFNSLLTPDLQPTEQDLYSSINTVFYDYIGAGGIFHTGIEVALRTLTLAAFPEIDTLHGRARPSKTFRVLPVFSVGFQKKNFCELETFCFEISFKDGYPRIIRFK